jgi:hypothetical protein
VANRLETLLTILMAPIQRFENACIQLLTQRTLTTAVGAQLDVLGAIVGQARQGQIDSVYSQYIAARILVNRATGKRQDLIGIASAILNNPSAVVTVISQAIATVFVRIDDVIVDAGTTGALVELLGDAVPLGVRLELQTSPVDDSLCFEYGTGGDGIGFDDTTSPGSGGEYSDVRSP